MIKRFGESVSMQDIESFAVNRTLEEMKEHARKKERDLYKEISTTEVLLNKKNPAGCKCEIS